MVQYKTIPKGYSQTEFPLPHNFKYQTEFSIDATGQEGTYLPIILNDEALVNADTVNVNPEHGSFAESNNAYCHKNSIIPRININLRAKLTKLAIETDKVQTIMFNWMPVYTAFESRLNAADSKTAVDVESILELQHESVGKSVYPIWSGTDLVSGTVGIHSTPTTALMGLTTDTKLESVLFDKELFFDALQYYTNSAMLKKVIGKMHRVLLNRTSVYKYSSNNFTMPMVKRVNEYTFCGILVWCPLITDFEQMGSAGNTTAISHIFLSMQVRYDEWNSQFDQTPS